VHQRGTRCLALVAPGLETVPDPSASRDATPAHGEHEVELGRLRAAGWEVVVADPGERFDRTWGRLGLHRQLTQARRAPVVGVRR
jgi:hypothetical protein